MTIKFVKRMDIIDSLLDRFDTLTEEELNFLNDLTETQL